MKTYTALFPATGGQVAVKVIRPEYADDPRFSARFQREVAAGRKVSSAFTTPVVDAPRTAISPGWSSSWIAMNGDGGPSDKAIPVIGIEPSGRTTTFAGTSADGTPYTPAGT
ncbi:hypothetical protein ACFH04_11870 [Streptomyces noboritoensis]|uniref:Serine/threonine protein kinase n=1 Tax=Streptomyces noboritoensis TaxID=67337 RepID=A0ABV6TF24_9ACTN